MATEIWVNIGSGNGLLPDGTKPLPEPMLTDHQWSPVKFISGQFHKRCLNHQSLKSVWKLHICNFIQISQRQWVKLNWGPGGRFKNEYELLNLRALKISMLYENHIFQCMGKIFCVQFQRVPLKFHTKYLTYTLKDVDVIHRWKFKSS